MQIKYLPLLFLLFFFSCTNDAAPELELHIPKDISLLSNDIPTLDAQIAGATAFAELEVFDRWGQSLYKSSDKKGLLQNLKSKIRQPTAQYVYSLKYRLINRNEIISQTGMILM